MVNQWKAILAVAVIFGTGLGTGIVATHLYGLRARPESLRTGPPKGPPGPGMRGDMLQKMQRDLSLSADQSHEIEAILKASQQRMKELWDTISPQASLEMERTRGEIREVLTVKQRQRFDEQVRLHEERHKRGRPKERNEGTPPEPPGQSVDPAKPAAAIGDRKCLKQVGAVDWAGGLRLF